MAANDSHPDKIMHKCDCCGVTFTCYRRDLTYIMCTFLMALRDMELSDGNEYHEFRLAIAFAYEHWKCTPSDYTVLARWKFLKTIKGNPKMKALTEKGHRFLNNELAVPPFHYKMPYDNSMLWSPKRITYIDLYKQYLKDKEEIEPFLEIKEKQL